MTTARGTAPAIGARVAGLDSGKGLSAPADRVGHENVNAGFFAAGAVGSTVSDHVSVEGELLYLKNDVKTGDLDDALGTDLNASVRTVGVLANAHYKVTPVGPFSLSFGGGVGYGESRYRLLGGDASKRGLIWQLMAHLDYPISDKVTWDLQYRYVRSPDFKDSVPLATPTPFRLEAGTHVVAVGARVNF